MLLLAWFLRFISIFFRKQNTVWMFVLSEGRIDTNSRALCDYVLSHGDISCAFLVPKKDLDKYDKLREIYPDLEFYYPNSWRSLTYRFSCGIYIITHTEKILREGFFSKLSGYKLINLWHGIPLKGMQNLDSGYARKKLSRLYKKSKRFDLFTVSSFSERGHIAGCFFLDSQKISVTGNPRNDWLLLRETSLPTDIIQSILKLRSTLAGRKLILYAPTFRDFEKDKKVVNNFDTDGFKELEKTLQKHNAVLGLRTHPGHPEKVFEDLCENFDCVMDMGQQNFPELEVVLRLTDLLVTDYSSLWIDFLLLDRPIVGYTYDLERYIESRGLLYDYDAIFPGDLCPDQQSLTEAIDKSFDQGLALKNKQIWVKNLLHKNKEKGMCKRVTQEILKL